MAAGYRDINTAKTVVGTLQKWPAKAGGRSPEGPAVVGTTVVVSAIAVFILVDNILSSTSSLRDRLFTDLFTNSIRLQTQAVKA